MFCLTGSAVCPGAAAAPSSRYSGAAPTRPAATTAQTPRIQLDSKLTAATNRLTNRTTNQPTCAVCHGPAPGRAVQPVAGRGVPGPLLLLRGAAAAGPPACPAAAGSLSRSLPPVRPPAQLYPVPTHRAGLPGGRHGSTVPCPLAVLYSLHQAWLAGVGAGLLLPAYQEAAAAAALLVGAGACSPLLLHRPTPSSAARCCAGPGTLIKLRPHSFGRNYFIISLALLT